MHSKERTSVPVQVEAVTEEELRGAVEMDWDKELRQHATQLRTKLLCLRKNNLIDDRTFGKLLRVQGKFVISVIWPISDECKFK